MWYSEVRTAPVARCGKIWNFQLPALVVDHATTPARSHLNRHSTAPLATIFFSQGDETLFFLFFFYFFLYLFSKEYKYCLFFVFSKDCDIVLFCYLKGLWHCFLVLFFQRILKLFSFFLFFKGLWYCFPVLFFQRIMKLFSCFVFPKDYELFSCFVFTKDYHIVFCFDFPRNMKYLFVVLVVYKDR